MEILATETTENIKKTKRINWIFGIFLCELFIFSVVSVIQKNKNNIIN